MNIIPLFCKTDDFFLKYEKWIATQCLAVGEQPSLNFDQLPKITDLPMLGNDSLFSNSRF